MKKRGVRLFLILVVGGAILAIVAGLCGGSRPTVRFRFLDGREPVGRHTERHKDGETTTHTYYFEGEVPNVSACAKQELTALGFWQTGPGSNYQRMFTLQRPSSTVRVEIREEEKGVYVVVERTTYRLRIRLVRWLH